MTLVQNGTPVTVKTSKAKFHLDERGDRVRLYVPRDTCDREVCFLRQLPRRLLSFLAIADTTAEAVICGILKSSSLVIVDEVLKDAGIIEVDGINRPLEPEVEEPQANDENILESTETQSTESGLVTPAPTESFFDPTTNTADPYIEVPYATSSRRGPRVLSTTSSPQSGFSFRPTPSTDRSFQDDWYAVLLDCIINAASGVTLPNRGAYAVDGLQSVPPSGAYPYTIFDTVLGTRSMERDKKVGAAGELYVSGPLDVQSSDADKAR